MTIYEACAASGPAFCVVVIAICTGGTHCIGRTVRLQAGPVNPELVQPANSAHKPIVLAAEQGLQPMARAFDCEDGDIVAVKGEGAHHGFLRAVDVERHEINALWETMAGQNVGMSGVTFLQKSEAVRGGKGRECGKPLGLRNVGRYHIAGSVPQ